MPGYWPKGRTRRSRVQASRHLAGRAAPMLALLLAACADPLAGPVDLFHDLEGGEIAAQRPPPPGAGMPYPKLGTVPPKPTLPGQAYRNGLQAQLLAERDRTERLAADAPISALPPPPPPAAPIVPPPQAAASGAASPTSAGVSSPVASATLDTVEAPAAPAPPQQASFLTIAGAPADPSAAPPMPPAPPPPATFEGVVAEPAPTPLVLPAGVAPPPAGTQVYFAAGATALPPSQNQALRDFLSHRHKQPIEIIGLGEASSDTPDGQAAAITLALRRAQSVATGASGHACSA